MIFCEYDGFKLSNPKFITKIKYNKKRFKKFLIRMIFSEILERNSKIKLIEYKKV
jgi:hypothetical protein